MGSIWTLGLALICAVIVYRAARPRPAFVIKVAGGRAVVSTGTVTPTFVRDVAEICARNQVDQAHVRGVVKGGRIVLDFSASLSPGCRQQIRNVWSTTGWKAPVAGGRRKP